MALVQVNLSRRSLFVLCEVWIENFVKRLRRTQELRAPVVRVRGRHCEQFG